MDDNNDRESDLSYGSSSSSRTNKTRIDEETLKMGTDPMKKLIPKGFLIHFISNILPQITKTIEITVVCRYLSLRSIPELCLLQPIYELLANNFNMACAASTSIFVNRNISKN